MPRGTSLSKVQSWAPVIFLPGSNYQFSVGVKDQTLLTQIAKWNEQIFCAGCKRNILETLETPKVYLFFPSSLAEFWHHDESYETVKVSLTFFHSFTELTK